MSKHDKVVNTKDGDTDSTKNDIDIRSAIVKLLEAQTFVRMSDLIKELTERVGVARITVTRCLDSLEQEKEIIKIRQDEFERYMIKEPDKRQVYIASKEIQRVKNHFHKIFEMFGSKDIDEVKIGIRELRHARNIYFNRYFLDADELNVVSKILERSLTEPGLKNDEIRNTLLMILFNEITLSHITPSDKKSFIETVRTMLDEYPTKDFYNKPNNPIAYLIYILGIYRDKNVVDRLENDAITCPPNIFQNVSVYYTNKFVAKIIDDNNLALMQYEAKLQKEEKVEALDFIENIRRYVSNELRGLRTTSEKWLYEDMYDQYEGED